MSEARRYAYVLALRVPMESGAYADIESKGTVNLAPGSSRHQVFEQIRSNMTKAARAQGRPEDTITTFWSLELDTL